MSLRLSETTQRILISTTSRFVAEYVSEDVLLTHAWPQLHMGTRLSEGSMSRSAFVLSFRTAEVPKVAGTVIPTYEYVGEFTCALLSVLFGKRFDTHGPFESNGTFSVPVLTQFSETCAPTLPQNSHKPRSDIAVKLDLREVARIEPMLIGEGSKCPEGRSFYAAAKFYLQALQNAESDAEVAYLHLITAGEILSNAHRPPTEDMLDDSVRKALDQIRQSLPDGEKIARMLAERMRQIKRRFVATIADLLDAPFFAATADRPAWARLTPETLSKRIGAAYDLRSRYVHTGVEFGGWVSPLRAHQLDEVQSGRPILHDPELESLLEGIPNYLGLERAIRYALFRFAEKHVLFSGQAKVSE